MQNGITTTIPLSGNFRVFRYFTLTPGVSVTSTQYFQTIRQNWNKNDSTIVTDTMQGFQTFNTYNATVSLSTNVYSLYSLGIHRAITIRDVLYPQLALPISLILVQAPITISSCSIRSEPATYGKIFHFPGWDIRNTKRRKAGSN